MPDTQTAADRGEDARSGPTRLFLLLAPLLYLAYALIPPPFQTPDEHQHLFRAWQLASFQLIGERRGVESGGELPPGLARAALPELGTAEPHAPRPVPRTTLGERFARATPVAAEEPPRFTNFLGSVTYTPVGYLPQVAAVWTGRALAWPVEWIVRLGRLLNAALTVALLYAAFRTLPAGRPLLLVIALLPMTAACAGSFGQDGLIIGSGAWLTALSLRAVTRRRWSRRDAVVAAALTVAITLAKLIYLPLAGLALIPRPAGVKAWRWAAPPVAAGLLAIALLAVWLRWNAGLVVAMTPGMPRPGEQAAHLLDHPLLFPEALARTYLADGPALLGTLFTFGWLNVGPVRLAFFLSATALILALWRGDSHAHLLPRSWRVWSLLVCAVVVLLLSLALYLAATPLGAPAISGLQGRYYIPIAMAALLPFLHRASGRRAPATLAITALMLTANAAALIAIWQAYYR